MNDESIIYLFQYSRNWSVEYCAQDFVSFTGSTKFKPDRPYFGFKTTSKSRHDGNYRISACDIKHTDNDWILCALLVANHHQGCPWNIISGE